jgi:hypothetical protein
MQDLLVAEPELALTFASAINDRVQIAADRELSNFTHAYRLTPVAEEEPGRRRIAGR